jgi:phage gp36-like protein
MSYATQADLVLRYSEASLLLVAAQADDDTALDDDKIARAIADAEAIVNLNVRSRYAVPLSPVVPDEIKSVACALARYGLYEGATGVPENVKDGRDSAMAVLKAIRDGDTPLECDAASSADPAATAQEPQIESDDQVMTTDSLKGF